MRKFVAGVFSTHCQYPHSVGTHEARMLDRIAAEVQALVLGFVV